MKKKILIIEDDQILLFKVKKILEYAEYKVLTACDGKLGITVARKKIPNLIISKRSMPGLDGFGVYRFLEQNESTRHIPFLFISEKQHSEDLPFGMNLSADNFLVKPFKEKDFINAVANRLENHERLKDRKKKDRKKTATVVESLDELRMFFRNFGDLVDVGKHEELYMDGRHASSIFMLEDGLIKTFQLDEYGKELITGILKKNDFLGFYSFKTGGNYPETAQAIENSRLFRFSSEEFIQTLQMSQKLTVEFAQLISDNLSIMKTHLLEMAYSSVLKKTTTTILEIAEKIQGDPQQYIRISRSDLASVAGISTESFIRSLSCLKKEGLIDIVGRDIKILNLQKLHGIR